MSSSATPPHASAPDQGAETARTADTEGTEPSPHDDAAAPDYPHGIHPGLVPGIAVDSNRVRFGMDWLVFGVPGAFTLAFVILGIISPETIGAVTDRMIGWAMRNLGWLFNITVIVILFFMLFLAFSRYGKIPLGRDGEEPEFSRFAWVAMMFGAGIGVGIFFYGPSEPLAHYLAPAPETVDAQTPAALHNSLAQVIFEWGPHAWAIYALVGGSVAYASYRRGRASLMSSVFLTLIGSRNTQGAVGKLIDMFAIVATVFGTAGALGIAALQIMQGVSIIGGIGEVGNGILVLIIALLGICVIISAVSGVARGIRYLSNINIVLTLAIVAFVFVTGPTLFLLNLVPSSIMQYGQEIFSMMGRSLSWGEETMDFQSVWSTFYFAWWIAWSPFVGIFLARISRGRTIKEFVLVTILVPSSILVVSFCVFGGTAIDMFRRGVAGITGDAEAPQILFQMFEHLPLAAFMPVLVCVVLAIFFITSADSASVVMGTLSSRGDPQPRKPLVVFWGVMMIGIAVVMLLAGGETTLGALQSLMILTAMPFAAVLLAMAVAFWRELATDPAAIRRAYTYSALDSAVRRGIEAHGDDWGFPVEVAPEGTGAGADFDSADGDVTDWYQRTDEEGRHVDYDYATDSWGDGWQPEDADGSSTAEDAGRTEAEGEPEDEDQSPSGRTPSAR